MHNYAHSEARWREHTDRAEFAGKLACIVEDPSLTNAARSARVEEFLLAEAVEVGVVR